MALIEYEHHVSVLNIILDTIIVIGDGFLEETLYPSY